MAESQLPIVYDAALLDVLDNALSTARLAPYVAAAKGDRKRAILLYLWNSRLAKAFLFPLNIAEVTIRNAMHQALSAIYGARWILNPPFALTPESERSRQAALGRLVRPAPDDLVAALAFDFWSNLFRREYQTLWAQAGLLATVFPHLPAGETRADVQRRVANINHFRNRIAHHEPIHAADHRSQYEGILELIALCSPTASGWVRDCSTVMAVVRTPPSAAGGLPGLPLTSTNLRPPPLLTDTTLVSDSLAQIAAARPPVIVVQPTDGGDIHVLTSEQVIRYLADLAIQASGLMDLSEHTLSRVLAGTAPTPFVRIDAGATTGDVLASFFPPNTPQAQRPQVVLVEDRKAIRGAILHPVARYA